VSLLDGLVSHVMVGHYSGEEALAAVDVHLDRLFG
jgi:Na+-driven multidrug efflux pump